MSLDPAFGLLVAIPLMILAVAAAIVIRPGRRAIALMAGCAAVAFALGCNKPAERSSETSTTTTANGTAAQPPAAAPPAAARPAVAFSAAQNSAAVSAKSGGGVSIDVLDARTDGARNPDGVTVGAGDTLHVLGWAYDERKKAPCEVLGLLVDGKRVFAGSYGYPRADVAAFYKDPARTNVGYSIAVPAAQLGNGAHTASVVCVGPGNDAVGNGHAVAVTVR